MDGFNKMKKYKFRLQPVLDYRESLEETAKKDLAEGEITLKRESGKLIRLKKARERLQHELIQMQGYRFDPGEAMSFLGYLEGMEGSICAQHLNVTEARMEVKKKREDLLLASTEKKKLEKLCEKGEKEHRQKVEKIEQSILDEINTTRHGRYGRFYSDKK
ncbi:MAG: flagellar export protein FliJ [bacterium]